MNRLAILAAALLATVATQAQDDMYFVPSGDTPKMPQATDPEPPTATYYSGSDRDVDEYNRRGSYYQPIDSLGNDIIDFDGALGAYPDSTADYACTRMMSRFDDYAWRDPYWAGYIDGRLDDWLWYDPWPYGWYFGSPWYYSAWYYPRWHYWWPHYHYGAYWPTVSYYRPYRGYTGTPHRGHAIGTRPSGRPGGRGDSFRNNRRGGTSNSGSLRNTTTRRGSTFRNNTPTTTRRPSISSGNSFGGVRSGGSFGGGNRGGSFGGGSRGGGFRGRR